MKTPADCVLLTDLSVANKIKDLSAHRTMVLEDVALVKVGRYMVLPDGARCVIARNDKENKKLSALNPKMSHITLLDSKGPLGLVESSASDGQ